MRSVFPVQANGTTLTGRAIRERRPVQIADVLGRIELRPEGCCPRSPASAPISQCR